LVPLTSLSHEQCKELLKSDDGVKKIMNFDGFSEGELTGVDLDDLKDNILLRYWKMKDPKHRKIILDFI
jgi:hypothetical protein